VPKAQQMYCEAIQQSNALTRISYEPCRIAQEMASAICQLACRRDALGNGVRGFLYAWKNGHRHKLQLTSDCHWYVETCPAYVATVDGVSKWSARIAWTAVEQVLQWNQVKASEVEKLGPKLRKLPSGSLRGGRHLLLTGEQVAAIDLATAATEPGPAKPYQRGPVLPPAGHRATEPARAGWIEAKAHTSQIQRLRETRTLAVKCPVHNDKDPSLVLWSNGGGMCMSCGWRASWRIFDGRLFCKSASTQIRIGQSADRQRITTTNTPYRPGTSSAGPVGGHVATRSTNTRHAGSLLREWQDCDGNWHRARSSGHKLSGDLIDILVRSEAASLGNAAEKAADSHFYFNSLPDRAVIADKLVSTGCVVRSNGPGWSGQWNASVQRWVLIDLDDLHFAGSSFAASRLAAVIDSDNECSGRFAVVQTSLNGLQVWVELAAPRFKPARWFEKPCVRQWYARLANGLLDAVRSQGVSGGYADKSSCGVDRWGRRPGWRMKDGQLFRSSLLHVQEPA
jgi:hypothetical protein